MVNTLPDVQVKTFETTLRHVAQQMGAKLRGTVQERGEQSKDNTWFIKGVVEATDKVSRLTATPVQDIPNKGRVAVPTPFHAGDAVEPDEIAKMVIDPLSTGIQTLAYAMNRRWDDRIIAAATGDAIDEGGSIVAYDYTANSIGAYTDPISFAAVAAVVRSFNEEDIGSAIPKIAVVGPIQIEKLMQLTQQTSMDYVRQSLQELTDTGIVHNWMGFTWIMSNRLLDGGDTGGGAGTKDLLFYTQRAMGTNVPKDIWARVAEDPSASFAWRIYTQATMGAVRIEDEQIKVLKCLDALVPA